MKSRKEPRGRNALEKWALAYRAGVTRMGFAEWKRVNGRTWHGR